MLDELLQENTFGYSNEIPADADELVLCPLVIDASGSVSSYKGEMERMLNSVISEFNKSAFGKRVLVSQTHFDSQVTKRIGFQAVANVQPIVVSPGGSTALYASVLEQLQNTLHYRKQQETQGVETKMILCVITDGADNESRTGTAQAVAKAIADFRSQDERNAGALVTILLGVGNDPFEFESAGKQMGFDHIQTNSDIRKLVGFWSRSVSTMSTGGTVSF